MTRIHDFPQPPRKPFPFETVVIAVVVIALLVFLYSDSR